MERIFQLQKRIVPEMPNLLMKRYELLRAIKQSQPVGRKNLMSLLNKTERILRSEVGDLKELGLLVFTTSGMYLSKDGEEILEQLSDFVSVITGVTKLQDELKEKFSLEDVIVVYGDVDKSPLTKTDLCIAASKKIQGILKGNDIVSVAGGTTLQKVAQLMPDNVEVNYPKNLMFIPSRGGLGTKPSLQATTICELMAKKTSGINRPLYLPEQLSKESVDSLMLDPNIVQMLELMKSANVVIHSVGEALDMATNRESSVEVLEKLKNEKAVGETLGCYFDRNGKVVHRLQTIGIQFEDIDSNKKVVTIAGGSSKGEAVSAFLKVSKIKPILIIDEAVAINILKK